jgi:regulator of protease activity HflC (stomatin/prohibitin superfamily)
MNQTKIMQNQIALSGMRSNRGFTLGDLLLLIGGIATLIAALILFDIEKISGTQLGVKETWGEGVINAPMTPKTYFLFPGFTQKVYKYDMTQQVYVMNDKDDGGEYAEGRKADAYVVQSQDQQDMRISLRVQWRRKAETIVELHKIAQDQVEERLLRPALLNIVKNQATLITALNAYSGNGLVNLQKSILSDLQNNDKLTQYLQIDDFVIEGIGLDPKYTAEIVARQVAVQAKLRADEETKVANANAEKAKAEAQADFEKQIVAAKRDYEKGVLEAKRAAEQAVLAAEADAKKVAFQAEAEKNRNVLIAEGEKEAAVNRAQAILALGSAEAESKKMQLSAFAVPGADAFVKIEVAKSMSEAFKNVSGYLPESMSISLLSEQYTKGVNMLVNPPAAPVQ